MTAPMIGASQNSQSWATYSPPANSAGPVLRAGLTEVLVTGIETRWISVRARPIGMPAKPDRGALRGGADDDEQEEEGHQDLHREAGAQAVLAGAEVAVAVRGEARWDPARLARGDPVEHSRGNDGADHLRDDVGHHVGGTHRPPAHRPTVTAGLK